MESGGAEEVAEIDTEETKRILEKDPENKDRQKRAITKRKEQNGKKKQRRPVKNQRDDNDEDEDTSSELEEFIDFFNQRKNQNDKDITYGLEKNVKPMKCVLKKFANVKFLGTLTGVAEDIDNEDVCGGICYQFNFENGTCKSVNYLKNTRKCELMADVFDSANKQLTKYITYYVETNRQSLYIIPSSCKQGMCINFQIS